MTRTRGEPPPSLIDKGFPFQVALHCEDVRLNFDQVMLLSHQLGSYRLNQSIYVHPDRYIIYMFAEERDAACFLKAFEGEWITPEQRRKRTWVPRYSWMTVGCYGNQVASAPDKGEHAVLLC
ncbi:hypothetical protein [Phyllobacterium sp. SB3]|uniref:hypothetical protein n=1 Tax=Phyllobacterium sp. SB3 TaxID=3156073 RepID=UPI0032AF6075